MEIKSCVQCGRIFAIKPYRAGTAKYCSPKCRGQFRGAARVRPLDERFWEKVIVRGEGECWSWTGATQYGGYGVLGSHGKRGKLVRAHRLSYEIHNGPIPEGMVIRHSCDNPACTNPRHLAVGTYRQNIQDAMERNRVRAHGRHGMAKLTEDAVTAIRSMRSAGATLRAIAAEFHISSGHVSNIVQGKAWRSGRC